MGQGQDMRHEVIVGVERRRRWSDDEKLSILAEIEAGSTVAATARRHDLTRQHIYQWRQALRRKGLWPRPGDTVFLQLEMAGSEGSRDIPAPDGGAGGGELSIVLANGRQIRCGSGVDDADLVRLIRIVEAA